MMHEGTPKDGSRGDGDRPTDRDPWDDPSESDGSGEPSRQRPGPLEPFGPATDANRQDRETHLFGPGCFEDAPPSVTVVLALERVRQDGGDRSSVARGDDADASGTADETADVGWTDPPDLPDATPLSESVDPDALDALVRESDGTTAVGFRHRGYEITVAGDGSVGIAGLPGGPDGRCG